MIRVNEEYVREFTGCGILVTNYHAMWKQLLVNTRFGQAVSIHNGGMEVWRYGIYYCEDTAKWHDAYIRIEGYNG